MRAFGLHLSALIVLLTALGTGITLYQIWGLDIPVTEAETDTLWTVDARVDFQPQTAGPVKVQLFIPPLNQAFVSLNESFIANNYGVSVNRQGPNRRVVWSSREANGNQTLYYRLVMNRRYSKEAPDESASPPASHKEAVRLPDPEKAAAEALLVPIQQRSADLETSVREAIQQVKHYADDKVRLLLAGDFSVYNRARVVALILSMAHINLEKVHTLRLSPEAHQQTPELWLRTWNGQAWLYFNPESGEEGLPSDRMIWWFGEQPLLSVEGGTSESVTFSLSDSQLNAIRLARLTNDQTQNGFLDYSLYGLPLATQQTYRILIVVPLGVFVILLVRNLIGLSTLGTFTPVLIALAFRETQLGFGITLFCVITALGLLLRAYLEHLKLQLLPRLAVVLTFVVIAMAAISLLAHRLGLERALSVSLFPMVILTMTIERISILWEERGAAHALTAALGTLVAASLAYGLMSLAALNYFIFTFPAVLLVLMAGMLALGRYRGYRLTELVRFNALGRD